MLTVEEFSKLQETGEFYYELRYGEMVRVPRPKFGHYLIQHGLQRLLAQACGSIGVVSIQLPFRALPEHELRTAQVAFIGQARWDGADLDDYLRGAPDLVFALPSA